MSKTKRQTGASVGEAIQQKRPFRSLAHETLIALKLTTEVLRWPLHNLLSEHGDLTYQQFNVLRILRGGGADGLPTLDIGERMVEKAPGITRLLDRMEDKGLVERQRSRDDRRRVDCHITELGQQELADLDEPIEALDKQLMSPLNKTELRSLIEMLNRIRTGNPASP